MAGTIRCVYKCRSCANLDVETFAKLCLAVFFILRRFVSEQQVKTLCLDICT